MNAIILESVLFLLLMVVVGVFVFSAIKRTSLGERFQQTANRKRIDEQVELTCPVHGLQKASELVRLPTGETLCPKCYKEAVHGIVD
ncbi:MAG: hypothetical protein ACO1Q7_11925 [Gemmatimonas sp.]